MKKIFVVCFALMLILTSCRTTSAVSLVDIAEVVGGVATSFGVHEAGHEIVGEMSGKVKWNGPDNSWDYKDKKNYNKNDWHYKGKKIELVSISGFAFQGIGSEILMSTTKRDNKFLIGYVGFNILNNIGYVIKTEMKLGDQTYSDLNNFKNKDQRRLVEAVVLAHAAWLSYRLWNDRDFKNLIGLDLSNGTPLLKASRKF